MFVQSSITVGAKPPICCRPASNRSLYGALEDTLFALSNPDGEASEVNDADLPEPASGAGPGANGSSEDASAGSQGTQGSSARL